MSRSARLLSLLESLRRRRYSVTGKVLAEELGISLRSLYRDIATLQTQGARIDGAAGVGFRLRPGFLMPPLMFSNEEIEALVLGSRWVADRADAPLATAASGALAKIASVLPENLREDLEGSGLVVGPSREPKPDGAISTAVRKAMREEFKVRVDYLDAQNRKSQRTIWPIALGFFESIQVVVAWCELRQSFRHFRLDRIGNVQPLPTRYPKKRRILLGQWRASEGIPES